MKTRILIADRFPLLRLGIRSCLMRETDMEIVGEAVSHEEMRSQTLELMPDVLILDFANLGRKSLETIRELRRHVKMKILVLTAKADKGSVISALNAGVDGYALKEEDLQAILAAIRSVVQGKRWFSPEVSDFFIGNLQGKEDLQLLKIFSDEDLEILRLVAEGLTNDDISLKIGKTKRTVEYHLTKIFRTLNVSTRTEAAVWAREHGFID